jgi:hypothetical protein
MSSFFDWLSDFSPMIIVVFFWLLVAPIRLIALFLLPPNSNQFGHPLVYLHGFFAFERV